MNANFLKNILSVPNYLSLPVAGIEICSNSIKYIEFINKNGEFSIKNFGEIFLVPNVVKNGDILNKNALIKALTEVKNKINSDFVSVSIPEEKTYIFDVKIPKEAESNIREALEFKIEENVPLKLNESSFEYEFVEKNDLMDDITLNVSVIPKKIISEYAEVLNQASLYPVSFELESKMIANSVISEWNNKNTIIMNIKDDSTILIGVIDGFVRLTSLIPMGENAIRETLLKTGLFSDELVVGNFFESDFSFEMTYTKESYSSLVNIFSIYKDEVEKFNEYIISKFPDKKTILKNVDKIMLCGKSSTLPGLAKHINQNIATEIGLANTLVNVFDIKEQIPVMKFQDSLSFVVPIGLVIKSYKQKNA